VGDVLTYVFIVLVVGMWIYAGYRIVGESQRTYAALRYVSPLLLLALALIVYAVWPADSGAADSTSSLILAWVLPTAIGLLVGAVVIDRRRARRMGEARG